MACINKNNLQYLIAYDPSNPRLVIVNGSAAVNARTDETFDYWYWQVSCNNSFRCFDIKDLIPADVLSKILNREIFLVIDNGLEPFFRTADGIYTELVIKENIPPEQIIFMASPPTMIDHVKRLAKQYNKAEIKVEWFLMFEWSLRNFVLYDNYKLPKTLVSKRYDKKFINFNRRWRLHRPLMVLMLKDRGLLDLGYVSLGESDLPNGNWVSKLREIRNYYINDPQILEVIDRNQDIVNLPPLYLDTDDLVTNRADQTSSTNLYYENTFFSVITETTFNTRPGYDGVPFLSEKIFKAIAMKHPFIMVTAPNSLQYLKQLGYRTFEGIIDESYDQEINDADRMIKVVNEIERLSKLSKIEVKRFLNTAREICEHNFQVLKNKENVIHKMN